MKRLEWLPPVLVMAFATALCVAGFVLRIGDAVGQEAVMPKHIAEYLRKTAEEALTPVWDLDYKPQGSSLIYGSFGDSIENGELGFPSGMTVRKVIDDRTVIVDLHWKFPARYRTVGPAGQSYYKLTEATKRDVMIKGLRIDGLVDGESYRVGKVLRAVGTGRDGSRTLRLLEPIDMTPYVKTFKLEAEKRTAD